MKPLLFQGLEPWVTIDRFGFGFEAKAAHESTRADPRTKTSSATSPCWGVQMSDWRTFPCSAEQGTLKERQHQGSEKPVLETTGSESTRKGDKA